MTRANPQSSVSFPDPKPCPHILLVDDDPIFGKCMEALAKLEKLPFTYMVSPRDLYQQRPPDDIAVILLDYNLGPVTGVQLANYLESHGRKIPIVLVSASSLIPTEDWPKMVKACIAKSEGTKAILELALKYQGGTP